MSNAFKMRNESVVAQYEDAMKTIEAAKKTGWKGTYVAAGKGSLYPEVAEMLINEGLDVLIRKNTENDFHSTNHVSWEFAQEGRIGTLKVEEEAILNQKVTDLQEKIEGARTEVQDKVEGVKEKLEDVKQKVEPGLKTAGKEIMNWVEPGLKKGLSAVENFAQAASKKISDAMEEFSEEIAEDEED